MKANQAEEQTVKCFEDVLHHVGGWGRYQLTLLVFFFFFCLFNAYVVYTPILFLHVPEHWCSPHPSFLEVDLSLEDIVDMTIPVDDGRRSQCHLYNRTSDDYGNNSWEQVPCPYGWTYNYTGYFTSAATEMNWVCQDSWKGPFTQSIFFVGGIFGTLIFGYMADHYGRYPTFLILGVLLFVTGIATPFCDNFAAFTAIRFLMGLTFDITIQTFYLIALEYVAVEKRSLIGNLSFALGFTLGGCYEPWLLRYLQDWKLFHHLLFAQTALIFVTPWFIHESVRWLATQGRVEESIAVLKSIAKTNGKLVRSEVFQSFAKMAEEQYRETKSAEKLLTWKDLFRTPRLRRHSLLVIATFMVIAGLFDGHVRNISNLSYSLYFTFTVGAALELPADLLVIWGIDNVGRRWSTFLSLALSGVCMAVCGVSQDNIMMMTVFSMVGRFWITYAMNTGQQLVFEVFPTTLRAQGSAMASVFSLASQIFSPYIVFSSVLSPSVPFIILSVGGFLGALLSIWLPETAGVDLPNTVQEAEEFGKNQSLFFIPILERRKKEQVGYNNPIEVENMS